MENVKYLWETETPFDVDELIAKIRKHRDIHWCCNIERLNTLISKTKFLESACDKRFAFIFLMTIYDFYVKEEYELANKYIAKFMKDAATFHLKNKKCNS